MPIGTRYSYGYNHKRKEVVIQLQTGSSQPIKIVVGVQAFLDDIDFIRDDKNLARFISFIRERKDLPVDHDFGPGGADFDKNKWDNLMGDKE